MIVSKVRNMLTLQVVCFDLLVMISWTSDNVKLRLELKGEAEDTYRPEESRHQAALMAASISKTVTTLDFLHV